jgi:type IV secretion system protein VirB10
MTASDPDTDYFALDDDLDLEPGVRRVNNMPIFIVIAVSVVFVLTMMLVMYHRSQNQLRQDKAEQDHPGESTEQANQIIGNHRNGFIPSVTPSPVIPESLPSPKSEQGQTPPLPASANQASGKDEKQAALEAELQALRSAKLEQVKTAIQAKPTVALSGNETQGMGNALTDELQGLKHEIDKNNGSSQKPSERYQQTIAALKDAGIIPSGNSQLIDKVDRDTVFDNSGDRNRWNLSSQIEMPEFRYELRAGFVIPGTLVGGINSDSPGQIVAQVGQNVYDTATGKHLLIPLGSRLVGSYDSDIAYGQERLLVAWQRIIFPDGKALDIGAMPGADSSGYSGFNDQTNHHFVRTFGSAFLMSAVVAATSLSQLNGLGNGGSNGQNYNQPTTAGTLNQALGQQLGQVTAQMIAKNLNIAPTLEIRPGFRFNVVVTKDLVFTKPYQAFDYSLQE